MMGKSDLTYLEIYKKAHENAAALFHDAELLYANRSWARAYALAYTALEELSKSQFAADVFTGLEEGDSFKIFFKDHKAKIRRIGWAHADAGSWPYKLKWIGPDQDDIEEIDPQAPVFQKRQYALYVNVDFATGRVAKPSEVVGEQDAKEIIHIVDVALTRIWEVLESQGRIGSKGFLK